MDNILFFLQFSKGVVFPVFQRIYKFFVIIPGQNHVICHLHVKNPVGLLVGIDVVVAFRYDQNRFVGIFYNLVQHLIFQKAVTVVVVEPQVHHGNGMHIRNQFMEEPVHIQFQQVYQTEDSRETDNTVLQVDDILYVRRYMGCFPGCNCIRNIAVETGFVQCSVIRNQV